MIKTRIVIAEDDPQLRKQLQEILQKEGEFHVVGLAGNGEEACEMIRNSRPDLVLLDLVMPGRDGFSVMESLREEYPETIERDRLPTFVLLTAAGSDSVTAQAFRLGASYLILKPVEDRRLIEQLHRVLSYAQYMTVPEKRSAKENRESFLCPEEIPVTDSLFADAPPFMSREAWRRKLLLRDVTEVLRRIGVPAHVSGFAFLREAIADCICDEELLQAVNKQLYPKIGKQFGCRRESVERAIRYVIGETWTRGDLSLLEELFPAKELGNRADRGPTNKQFIAQIAEKMRRDFKRM